MFFNKINILSLFCLLNFQVFGQILNGSFEEWITNPDGDELPLSWDALLENTDSCVIKSNVSSQGLYSLKLSSLNVVEGFFSPAYIGTKFKPNTYKNKVTFQYLIDSIAGESQGIVEIWQFLEEDYQLVTSRIYDHTSADFISESIDFTLLSLDSILIVLVAQNHALTIGYDGFISVLFDNLVLDNTSSEISVATIDCNIQTVIPINGLLELNKYCSNYKFYRLFSITGKLIDAGKIESHIHLSEPGINVLHLYNSIGDSKILKILVL